MVKRVILVFATLLFAGAVFAQAYKWTDENGIVHYSDRPHPGAVLVQLSGNSNASRPTQRPRPAARTSNNAAEQTDQPPSNRPFAYERLEVATPGAEETLWNIAGVLNVTLSIEPALRTGDQVRVYLNGVPTMATGTTVELQEVFRGVHRVQAEIVDETGKLMMRSEINRFYVQQNSVIN